MRLAELVAALSLATDLGLGLPSEHILRQTRIALRLADRVGADEQIRTECYYVSLLAWVGCTADAHEMASLFGDDLKVRADSYLIDRSGRPLLDFVVRRAGSQHSPLRRAGVLARLAATRFAEVEQFFVGHCRATGEIAGRLGFGDGVCTGLGQTFERWDGNGIPTRCAGEEIELVTRITHLADVVEVHHRLGGIEAAIAVASERSGGHFDPTLVAALCEAADEILGDLDATDSWDLVLAEDPGLRQELAPDDVDEVLAVFGDMADMKSPHLLGHSRGVARLAAGAAETLGLIPEDVRLVQRAGMVHDVGRIGVSSAIWDKPGPLSPMEWERVRTHPYLTGRVFQRTAELQAIGSLAALHHERLDGSGYPQGLTGDTIPPLARLLAAADTYQALVEERPHRPAHDSDAAARLLRAEAADGRLEGLAVEAVLDAAGHDTRVRPERPAGLSPREVEVLTLVARGRANREIAEMLGVAKRTVDAHVDHIYTKLGVTNRATAAIKALRLGLLPEEPSRR